MGTLSNYFGFKNYSFTEEMLPELLLLGELEHKQVPTDDGRLFNIDIIHYEGKQYIMKQEDIGRWFDQQ